MPPEGSTDQEASCSDVMDNAPDEFPEVGFRVEVEPRAISHTLLHVPQRIELLGRRPGSFFGGGCGLGLVSFGQPAGSLLAAEQADVGRKLAVTDVNAAIAQAFGDGSQSVTGGGAA